MEALYIFLLSILAVQAQVQQRHQLITHVTPAYTTVTKTVIPTCYEPAETLNFCYRKKKQLALVYDPSVHASADSYGQAYEAVPLSFQSLGKSGIAKHNFPGYQEAPEIIPSFQNYQQYNANPGEFINLMGGFVTKTKTIITVTATVTLQKAQTVLLDCIHPGSYVPSNFCDVSMIFPSPPEGVSLSQYCYSLGQLANAKVVSCEEAPTGTGVGVYVLFGKGPYGPYLSRKSVMKSILLNLMKTCNLNVGTCHLPGLPVGWSLNIYNIYVSGITNLNVFITEILIEILGVGNGCPYTNPFFQPVLPGNPTLDTTTPASITNPTWTTWIPEVLDDSKKAAAVKQMKKESSHKMVESEKQE